MVTILSSIIEHLLSVRYCQALLEALHLKYLFKSLHDPFNSPILQVGKEVAKSLNKLPQVVETESV